MHRRKKLNLKIKWELQKWLLTRILLAIFVSVSVALLILYFFSHKEIGESFYKAHFTIKYVSDLLLPIILLSGVICLAIGIFLAIFLPQKIAGPIYRVEEDLKYIRVNKDFTKKISLRKDDQFKSLAQEINLLLSEIKKDLLAIEKNLEKIERDNSFNSKSQSLSAIKNIIKQYKL
ncbi:putative methyl-accepting chemotaxis sensory transducer [Thermodesulfatator indicus DSM 15286]|uniref:Methyl-accepting chemotaxis sensory transducer n=1 Tax=Thermodesulfatator indicus (strain DSM 15286 / JCM 11887 / CIR29812) TaxID=667014 RepID=F8ABW6_THEID|nr:methyl-accepting chemotaxis protein [Thermodesulfatator indicus]AEH45658.1 putative methyl-accepting chemotaxis sensory transducer [Thermodesulfatator indicus DSM 15286]